MIVKTGDFFLYVTFQTETGDFRRSPNKVDKMKAAIPEEERHYDSIDKKWILENNEHNIRVLEELGGANTPEETTKQGD